MAQLTVQERLKQAQGRIKTLTSNRETIIGDIRVEEQKLKQAYGNLKELGVESPENLSIEKLMDLEAKYKAELETLLLGIEEELDKGETLIKQYKEIQGE